MNELRNYSTWVEVDLSAIQNNVNLIKKKTRRQVMAVVKANGYGHGAIQTAKAALAGGASWCGLARVEEALELREAGLACPLLLFGWVPPGQIERAILNEISMTVWDQEQIMQIGEMAARLGREARLHLKVDTGMGRLGCAPDETLFLARKIIETPSIMLEGLYTHFARADEPEQATTNQQERVFLKPLYELESQGLRPATVHSANSAASLTRPSAYFNMIRFGIAMYGLHPSDQCRLPQAFRPALSWKSVLSQVKMLPPGSGVSYGHEYITHNHERIGTIPLGYADGFRRTKGNQVLVHGNKTPVIGRVCMDQIMVQLDQTPQAQAGDEVVIIGSQEGKHISAEEAAKTWGTINYEVTCGIGARVPRIYH